MIQSPVPPVRIAMRLIATTDAPESCAHFRVTPSSSAICSDLHAMPERIARPRRAMPKSPLRKGGCGCGYEREVAISRRLMRMYRSELATQSRRTRTVAMQARMCGLYERVRRASHAAASEGRRGDHSGRKIVIEKRKDYSPIEPELHCSQAAESKQERSSREPAQNAPSSQRSSVAFSRVGRQPSGNPQQRDAFDQPRHA